ncbi:MAG: hypothetical protein CR986_06975 [Ignavibacteriae bacterium]|nr:MAG: hypothetical protein CR986_06975 [Ignavibacteriota bacterium]
MNLRKIVIVIFLIFLSLRIITLLNADQFEDHDSIQYLTMIRNIADGDFDSLFGYNPDKTFVFASLGALTLPITNSEVISARLVSLLSSIILFFVIYFISLKLTNRKISLLVLLLYSIHPLLVGFSVGILTEPLYVTIIYSGVYIFLLFLEKPSIKYIFLLALVFSLGFLNRTEGIIFIALIPGFMFLLKIIKIKLNISWQKTFIYSFLYVLLFSLFISPQIYRVSSQLGKFALNGRQVWQLILHKNDGRPYNAKIRGLDYSESEVNLIYLMKHPELRKELKTQSSSIANYFSNVIVQLKIFFKERFFDLFGKFEVLILILGIFFLFWKKRFFSILIIFLFLSMFFIPPLLHDVDIRHILILIPFLIIVLAIGIYDSAEFLIEILHRLKFKVKKNLLISILFLGVLFFVFPRLKSKIEKPAVNDEYNKNEIITLANLINPDKTKDRKSNIVSIKTYLSYFVNGKFFPFPFTNYKKLIRYCELNHIDYLLLDNRNMQQYEVLNIFSTKQNIKEFDLVYQSNIDQDNELRLYKFLGEKEMTVTNSE